MLMTPWVQRLLLANLVVFAAQALGQLDLRVLELVPSMVLLRPWTLVTYMFLHAGLGHLLPNALMLFFFGPRLEERLGSRRFIWFYLACGVAGAVLSLVLYFFAPFSAMVGASGAVLGVVAGFARYWPRDEIYIMGVLPLQARTLALLMVMWSVFAGVTGAQANVAHFAHLGGLVAGWALLQTWERQRRARLLTPVTQVRASSAAGPAPAEEDILRRWKAIPRERLHEINREELDLLLKKVNKMGVRALSASERAFLDRISDLA